MRFLNCSDTQTRIKWEHRSWQTAQSATSMSARLLLAPVPIKHENLSMFYFSSNKCLDEQSCCKLETGRQGQVCNFLKYSFRACGTETPFRHKP